MEVMNGFGYLHQNGGNKAIVSIPLMVPFMNQTFCVANPTTEVFYNDNALTGHKIGTMTMVLDTYATGGCSSWLNHYSEFTR